MCSTVMFTWATPIIDFLRFSRALGSLVWWGLYGVARQKLQPSLRCMHNNVYLETYRKGIRSYICYKPTTLCNVIYMTHVYIYLWTAGKHKVVTILWILVCHFLCNNSYDAANNLWSYVYYINYYRTVMDTCHMNSLHMWIYKCYMHIILYMIIHKK